MSKLTWKRVGSADEGTLEYRLLADDKHVATVTNEGDVGEPNWTISTVAGVTTLSGFETLADAKEAAEDGEDR